MVLTCELIRLTVINDNANDVNTNTCTNITTVNANELILSD